MAFEHQSNAFFVLITINLLCVTLLERYYIYLYECSTDNIIKNKNVQMIFRIVLIVNGYNHDKTLFQ